MSPVRVGVLCLIASVVGAYAAMFSAAAGAWFLCALNLVFAFVNANNAHKYLSR